MIVVVGGHSRNIGKTSVKARIEAVAVVGSGSGIVWGAPARPLKQYLRQLAVINRIGRQK